MAIQKRVLLNRAVFAQRPYDSGALTVLTTLLHRFTEPGDYDVAVRSPGQRDRRLRLRVVTDSAPAQINIDLAALGQSAGEPGCCPGEADYKLQTNGVVGFYASQGVAAYSVQVKRSDMREKKLILDSASQIPAGDLFAVTLVRPGAYKVADTLGGKHEAVIQVVAPPVPKPESGPRPPELSSRARLRYRPDQPTTVTFDKNGFSSKEVKIYSGQTAVFFCQAPARLRVELAKGVDGVEREKVKRFNMPPAERRSGGST
jgi:hypothetical protein